MAFAVAVVALIDLKIELWIKLRCYFGVFQIQSCFYVHEFFLSNVLHTTYFFTEAQLLYNQIDDTHNVTLSFVDQISSLFVDRFGSSLQFCHLEFDKKAIADDFMAHTRVF